VNEVQLGDFTRLNTTEYKHYGFFHRIRQKLEQFWGKSIREKANALYRNGRRIPASENLITSLQVILNEEGEIISVKIISTSGIRELDDAAINSFNQAGPFPNPPKDLLVNGRAVIEWGFVVKS
jgi:protein TonB